MNPFRRAWRWLRDGMRDVFVDGPRRKPNRPRCVCKHPWCDHSAKGCEGDFDSACVCRLNREGKPARRALVAVKEPTHAA